jgi:hypothetical protein
VREIFTMTPNFLIVTCIFPSLWESWFKEELDRSVSERIAQQTVTLDTFDGRPEQLSAPTRSFGSEELNELLLVDLVLAEGKIMFLDSFCRGRFEAIRVLGVPEEDLRRRLFLEAIAAIVPNVGSRRGPDARFVRSCHP